MLVLNFAHPITEEQQAQIEALTGHAITRIIDIPSHIDVQQPIEPQVRALADAVELSSQEWQTLPILINPPSLNFSAVVLLAELHGRMGYFPPIVRLRPVQNSVPPRFEVAEIVDLQGIRDRALAGRWPERSDRKESGQERK